MSKGTTCPSGHKGPKGPHGRASSWDPNYWFAFGRKKEAEHPVRVAILTSWDLPRLQRAIQSVKSQQSPMPFWVEINSTNQDYIAQATALCKKMRAHCHISESTGRAGVGKQAVFDGFGHQFEEPFLYLLDGDDWLYPCASRSLYHTVLHGRGLDVVTYVPLDVVQSGSGWVPIAEGVYVNFWNGELGNPRDWEYGPGQARWLWTANPTITGPGRTVLFSRLATRHLMWHPTIGCYEDTLLLLDSLAMHQEGTLFSACSMAQDTFIFDRTSPECGQGKNDLVAASRELQHEAQRRLSRKRSSVGELPLLFQDSRITYEDKLAYAKQTYPEGMPR